MKVFIFISLLLFTLMISCSDSYKKKVMTHYEEDSTVQVYINQLKSEDEEVRSKAAFQLYKINHSYALEACIKTIDDNPDLLHLDYTPSVHCLIQIGKEALYPLTELMLSKNEMTRLRALRAIEQITLNLWKQESLGKELDMEEWRVWWNEIDLDYESNEVNRIKSIEKLKAWINSRK